MSRLEYPTNEKEALKRDAFISHLESSRAAGGLFSEIFLSNTNLLFQSKSDLDWLSGFIRFGDANCRQNMPFPTLAIAAAAYLISNPSLTDDKQALKIFKYTLLGLNVLEDVEKCIEDRATTPRITALLGEGFTKSEIFAQKTFSVMVMGRTISRKMGQRGLDTLRNTKKLAPSNIVEAEVSLSIADSNPFQTEIPIIEIAEPHKNIPMLIHGNTTAIDSVSLEEDTCPYGWSWMHYALLNESDDAIRHFAKKIRHDTKGPDIFQTPPLAVAKFLRRSPEIVSTLESIHFKDRHNIENMQRNRKTI